LIAEHGECDRQNQFNNTEFFYRSDITAIICTHKREAPLQLDKFIALRPYLYHLTDPNNLQFLIERNAIVPASILMDLAGSLHLLRQKRSDAAVLSIDGYDIHIRDQGPLYAGKAGFAEGFSFADFVESLNCRVFFWPGTVCGPIAYGIRHFERYQNESPTILRVSTVSLLQANPAAVPHFCKYNSGSPRPSGGIKSPRGLDTFLPAEQFPWTPGKVVEVTFDCELALPPDIEFGPAPEGPWQRLKPLSATASPQA
jgi:hypothetical protein